MPQNKREINRFYTRKIHFVFYLILINTPPCIWLENSNEKKKKIGKKKKQKKRKKHIGT